MIQPIDRMRKTLLTIAAMCCLGTVYSCNYHPAKKQKKQELPDIKLPPGFHISYFARDVSGARSLTLGDKGTVFAGNREGSDVYALVDEDHDGVADKRYVVAKGLETPNGVAYHNGALYIAEISRIWRLDDIENNLSHPPRPVLVYDQLPKEKHHGWKYIAFGPDGMLYIPVGAPCNNCNDAQYDQRFASICRMKPDGTGFEVFAHGVRNTVGFDWHPQTKELWFTENGRDQMGDDIPADELNKAPQKGMHFGYPFCHQGDITDPEFGKNDFCENYTPPVAKLGPHVAALGMKFYTGNMFPTAYKDAIFIAEHGSWNRSERIGYRITLVRQTGGKPVYEVFAEGWLKDKKAWGRPVDVLQLKDGSLLVSDDMANAVYRISYQKD
ncbi:MAG: sorbosone dehydrogenase family protein [Flavipsychrobacter sp.]|nr:sorbosone dehydrogenase family protein [Flavipsychrobacter sp.]